MNPSSAMALVSSMPGAAMPAFLSACSALEMASPFFSQPISKVVAMAQANAVLMNVRLVVIIVPSSRFDLSLIGFFYCFVGRVYSRHFNSDRIPKNAAHAFDKLNRVLLAGFVI